MSCADIQNSLVEYLLNELDDAEQTNVEQHLASDCEACHAELHRLSDSMDLLWQSVPNPPLPPLLREQVLAKCLNTPPSSCESKTSAVHTKLANKSPAIVLGEMLLAFAAGVLLMTTLHLTIKQFGDRSVTSQQAAVKQNQVANASRFGTGDTPDALEMSGKPYKQSHFITLHRQSKANELSGQLLWDKLNREIHVYCFGLSTPPAGKQYTLWMVGSQKTVRIVDELKVDAAGECRTVAHWPDGEFQYVQVVLSSSAALDTLSANEVALTSDAIPPGD